MKTPYDSAVRVAERRLDQVRAAIGKAVGELARLESAQDEADAALRRECLLACNDHRLTTEFFFTRARDQRARLMVEREAAQVRLDTLRSQAVACYGEHQAVDTAAARFREEAVRIADAAEQAALDDIAASRLHRRARRASPRRAAPVAGAVAPA